MPTLDLGNITGPKGDTGATGATGAKGDQGIAGPNNITTATDTNITGWLKGNGSKVIMATPTAFDVGVSNKNLLYNWDLRNPVNQRGVTGTISTAGYFLDLWKLLSGPITIDTANKYITFAAGAIVDSIFEATIPPGVYTVSLLLSDNNVHSCTVTITGSDLGYYQISTSGVSVNYYPATSVFRLYVPGASAVNVRAIKLELGSVSTLAYDPPADFGEQLTICQRYFRRIKNSQATSALLFVGVANPADAAYINGMYYFGNIMRLDVPTITASSVSAFEIRPASSATTENSIGCNFYPQINGSMQLSVHSATTYTAGESIVISLRPNEYMDVSAEL